MSPENQNEPEVVEIDLDKVEAARREMAERMLKAAHNWRQMGTLINCTSCPFTHGFAVPPGTQLAGIDDSGKPIFRQIW